MISGCAEQLKEVGRPPVMSPIGSGMQPSRVAMPVDPELSPEPAATSHSTWRDRAADLYRDARATRIGDILTVKISIKDKASLDNSSVRSRDSKLGLTSKLDFALGTSKSGSGSLDGNAEAKTSSNGSGTVARSETIELMIAATVTEVLPNGNLVISGAQEVLVNFDVRVLNVGGIVRPRDVATDNSISYEKIAEARIAYGGRGRTMDVQQPGVGQQILDIVSPM